MGKEFETVPYTKLQHVNVFVNNILYRNYHLHNETELLFALGGTCTVNLINRKLEVGRGSVVLLNPHQSHEISGRNGADFLVIQLSSRLLNEYFPVFPTTRFLENDVCAVLKEDAKRSLWQTAILLAEHYLRGEKNFELPCIAAAATLLSLLYGFLPYTVSSEIEYLSDKKAMARMERIAASIEKNYVYGISLQELAAEEKLTVTYLSHFFTEHFGVTFQEYLNNLRFEHALRLIDNAGIPLVEIAMHSGFSDPKYMTQAFKKRFGCTPKDFRRSGRGKSESPGRKTLAAETAYRGEDALRLLSKFKTEENL